MREVFPSEEIALRWVAQNGFTIVGREPVQVAYPHMPPFEILSESSAEAGPQFGIRTETRMCLVLSRRPNDPPENARLNMSYEEYCRQYRPDLVNTAEYYQKSLDRSYELLRSMLTAEQCSEMDDLGTITITTSKGKVRLMVHRPKSDAVTVAPPAYNIDCSEGTFCAVINGNQKAGEVGFPYFDHIIMQVLMLRSQPEVLLAAANRRGDECQTANAPTRVPNANT